MGKPTGFIEYPREMPPRRPVKERVRDYRDVYAPFPEEKVQTQAARCMDCGVPFCQSGCPLGNVIPDWNDLVYRGRWREAFERLRATNNFPEFTGRICPAPCESACVLGLIEPPVTIEQVERTIAEHAYAEGWVVPRPPLRRTGRRVAVIGSGPAGLACADQLNQAGHTVTVFERDDRIGGLLRYGIPDFKLEKDVLDRRLAVMEAEGVAFCTGADVGRTVPVSALDDFDAVVLCAGATKPRDLNVPGRELAGIHFAWDFLRRQNKRIAGDAVPDDPTRDAAGKDVIVIGGGDTGSDCVGTANRQGARSVTQFELMPLPPETRPPHQPWPFYPMVLRTSSSHEEGVDRQWSVMTTAFLGTDGHVEALQTVRVRPVREDGGRLRFEEVPGSERTWPAGLVLLAMGYTGPEPDLLDRLGLERTPRGTVATDAHYRTSRPGFFAAGDVRRGASLVVWAIAEGREVARAVDAHLTGFTALPVRGEGDLPLVR
ncbi:MAG: glutamate synthase subunit beta [Bacteroidetes bacterium]|nr:MAG: glutamate synthase subunit beta [Bacteroidota bacterium]